MMKAAGAALRIILIRHAETAYTVERRYQGHRDIPLSEHGINQARLLGASLRRRFEDIDSARVCSSDLQRAARTAELALGRPADHYDARLREISFGDFEGLTAHEIEERYGSFFRNWLEQPKTVTPPNAESVNALQARLTNWLDGLEAGTTTVVFTHGGAIRVLLGLLDPIAETAIASPCDSVCLVLRPDRRTLAAPPQWHRFRPSPKQSPTS
jgi:broad specificity phosphatase PhoE